MAGALAGLKVIDVSQARAGPTCVRILSDMGAEVIQVVRPRNDNQDSNFTSSDNSNLHRNKRSIGIDLQKDEGRQVFMRLVKDADFLVENFRADVKYRLGIDYDSLVKINPRLIYGSISGFGQDGPYGPRPGVDQIAQGLGGIMSVTGPPGSGPWRVGIAVCDLTAGMFLAHAMLGALHERERSGMGQWVTTSLLESAVTMLDFQAMRWLVSGEVPEQAGNEHPVGFPTGIFETKDGIINLSATSDRQFRDFLTEMGMAEYLEDARFKDRRTRWLHRDVLLDECRRRIKEHESEPLIERLNQIGVPAGPVLTIDKVFDDPQVKHLGMAQNIESPRNGKVPVVRSPFNLMRTPTELRTPSPGPGEHTREILVEHGFGEGEIASLANAGFISKD